jgi:hypothetical protein
VGQPENGQEAVKCGNGYLVCWYRTYWYIYLDMYEETFVVKPSDSTVKKVPKKVVETCFCVWCI